MSAESAGRGDAGEESVVGVWARLVRWFTGRGASGGREAGGGPRRGVAVRVGGPPEPAGLRSWRGEGLGEKMMGSRALQPRWSRELTSPDCASKWVMRREAATPANPCVLCPGGRGGVAQ